MKLQLLVVAGIGAAIAATSQAQTIAVADCPDNFAAFSGTSAPLVCNCAAEAVKRAEAQQLKYPVLGMGVYPSRSPLCLSAVHAGVLDRKGGAVTVIPEAGRDAYAGVTRNGVTSRNFRGERSSFRFATANQDTTVGAAPSRTPDQSPPEPAATSAVSVCPDSFSAFAGKGETVVCACTAEAVKHAEAQQVKYPVLGMDVYPGRSPLCLSAVHAGVVGRDGGPVTVIPEAGRDAYPGVTRNGITSRNFRGERSSFRFAAAASPIVVGNAPVQQPIAATIQQTGQVQLYIQFRFNSAELDEAAAPTLIELREALNANPGLRLVLIGHTDAVGTPEYNRSLSLRRAQSVTHWLIAQGIPPKRLGVDGKGLEQPIADNNTEEGRALNRRVQALRIQ